MWYEKGHFYATNNLPAVYWLFFQQGVNVQAFRQLAMNCVHFVIKVF